MGQNTNIEWCDDTVNCTTGCDGCELWVPGRGGPCYAGKIHVNRLAKSLPVLYSPDFGEVRLAPGRMAKAAAWSDLTGTSRPGKPWLDGQPRVIFIGDLGDVFSKDVPFDYLRDELIGNIVSTKGRRHLWLLLTKQPRRAAEFAAWLNGRGVAWPDNVMTGTSVTSEATTSRIGHLFKVPGRKFISAEPLWGPVDLEMWLWPRCPVCKGPRRPVEGCQCYSELGADRGLDLVIVGGESGKDARPCDVDWLLGVVRQCQVASVPVFVKQVGSRPFCTLRDANNPHYRGSMTLGYRDAKGGNPEEWQADLRVREFPTAPVGGRAAR